MAKYNTFGAEEVTLVDGSTGVAVPSGSTSAPSAVQGNVAAGVADAGNPVKVGGKYTVTMPNYGDGQRSDLQTDNFGNLRVQLIGAGAGGSDGVSAANVVFPLVNNTPNTQAPFATELLVYNGATRDRQRGDVNGIVVQSALSNTYWASVAVAGGIVSSIADTVLKAAAGVGVRNYLKTLTIAHDLLSAATEFVIKDGATIIYRGKLQTPAVEAGSGAPITFDPPLRGTANTALNFALLTSVTGGVFVNAQGYTGA